MKRKAAEEVIDLVSGCDIYGDKGFIGQQWQEEINHTTANQILTVKCCNQSAEISVDYKRLIGRIRQRIESVFNEILSYRV